MAEPHDDREWSTASGDGGLAEAFGSTNGSRDSVLDRLGEMIGTAPRVLLRDIDPLGGPDSLVHAGSGEMPVPGDRPARLQLLGEIAGGGIDAVLKGRDNRPGEEAGKAS